MGNIDFITSLHKKGKRNYLKRVIECDKAQCAYVAKKFDKEYWDGDRKYGYGGYSYDGRWKPVAETIVKHYKLKDGQRVLDVGCGKGFLLYEMQQIVPDLQIKGIDVSKYALEHAKEEIKPSLDLGSACELPYPDKHFDLVISLTTLHNLYIYDLEKAFSEITRVSKRNAYIVVESYRNEEEKTNLLYWQLTCECLFTPAEWECVFKKFGYKGDYSFIYFE